MVGIIIVLLVLVIIYLIPLLIHFINLSSEFEDKIEELKSELGKDKGMF